MEIFFLLCLNPVENEEIHSAFTVIIEMLMLLPPLHILRTLTDSHEVMYSIAFLTTPVQEVRKMFSEGFTQPVYHRQQGQMQRGVEDF